MAASKHSDNYQHGFWSNLYSGKRREPHCHVLCCGDLCSHHGGLPSQYLSSLWTLQALQIVFSACLYRGFARKAARKTLVHDSDHAPLDESLSDSDSVDHAPHAQLVNDDDLSPDSHSIAEERPLEDGPQQSLSDRQQVG